MSYNQNDAVRLSHILEMGDRSADYTAQVAQAAAAAINERELLSNKTTSITGKSTDAQYPSAKAVYEALKSADNGPQIVTISLSASWSGNASPYTQTVAVSGGTAKSVVDLHPDTSVVGVMLASGTKALLVQNNNGTFTAYAYGAKPSSALSVQAVVTEAAT